MGVAAFLNCPAPQEYASTIPKGRRVAHPYAQDRERTPNEVHALPPQSPSYMGRRRWKGDRGSLQRSLSPLTCRLRRHSPKTSSTAPRAHTAKPRWADMISTGPMPTWIMEPRSTGVATSSQAPTAKRHAPISPITMCGRIMGALITVAAAYARPRAFQQPPSCLRRED
jgi:hypothetical protein